MPLSLLLQELQVPEGVVLLAQVALDVEQPLDDGGRLNGGPREPHRRVAVNLHRLGFLWRGALLGLGRRTSVKRLSLGSHGSGVGGSGGCDGGVSDDHGRLRLWRGLFQQGTAERGRLLLGWRAFWRLLLLRADRVLVIWAEGEPLRDELDFCATFVEREVVDPVVDAGPLGAVGRALEGEPRRPVGLALLQVIEDEVHVVADFARWCFLDLAGVVEVVECLLDLSRLVEVDFMVPEGGDVVDVAERRLRLHLDLINCSILAAPRLLKLIPIIADFSTRILSTFSKLTNNIAVYVPPFLKEGSFLEGRSYRILQSFW